jgi:hypothetical protein
MVLAMVGYKRPVIQRVACDLGRLAQFADPACWSGRNIRGPGLNPIENAFSKLKRLAHSNAKKTIDDLWENFELMLQASGKPECSNYIKHCGYITE